MPMVIAFLVGMVFVLVSLAKKKEAAQKAAQQQAQARRQTLDALDEAAKKIEGARHEVLRTEAKDARPQTQAELRKRLEEKAERQLLERRSLEKTMPPKPAQPVRARDEKPLAAHSDDDCGGGSIHDGYHEGVTQFDKNRPAAVAGRLGHRLADEDERIEKEKIASENAKRAMARIAKLPPLAQGMVYSEILGRPKSETA